MKKFVSIDIEIMEVERLILNFNTSFLDTKVRAKEKIDYKKKLENNSKLWVVGE
jgi:hypothetical protein